MPRADKPAAGVGRRCTTLMTMCPRTRFRANALPGVAAACRAWRIAAGTGVLGARSNLAKAQRAARRPHQSKQMQIARDEAAPFWRVNARAMHAGARRDCLDKSMPELSQAPRSRRGRRRARQLRDQVLSVYPARLSAQQPSGHRGEEVLHVGTVLEPAPATCQARRNDQAQP